MTKITLTIRTATNVNEGHDTRVRKVLRCGTLSMRRSVVIAMLPVVIALWPHYAFAQDPVPVETQLIAEIRENVDLSDGRRLQRFVPAQVIDQGDVIFYTVEIRNPTMQPARDVAVVQRIPGNTTYVPGSASGPSADITFSVDGGYTFLRAKELTVVTPAGATRAALPADYTHIRWQLRNVLAPGSVALARFQAVFR